MLRAAMVPWLLAFLELPTVVVVLRLLPASLFFSVYLWWGEREEVKVE